jgi:uncharacterized protein
MRTLQILTILIILTVSAMSALAQDSFAPWDFNSGKAASAKGGDEDKMSVGAKALSWGVHFYRETISQVDGERCKMYPSCSAYSLEAIKKHGFFLGYVMTADRLIHESNEMDDAPKIKLRNGKERYYDPVEANDFWWSGK